MPVRGLISTVRAAPRVRRLFSLGLFGVGLNTFGAVAAQPGQALNLPVPVTNHSDLPLYFTLAGLIYEATTSGATMGTVNVGGQQFVVGGHMTDPARGGATTSVFSVGPHSSGTVGLRSGSLAVTGQSEGVYLTLHAYADSAMAQEVPESPLVAYTNAFLTVAQPYTPPATTTSGGGSTTYYPSGTGSTSTGTTVPVGTPLGGTTTSSAGPSAACQSMQDEYNSLGNEINNLREQLQFLTYGTSQYQSVLDQWNSLAQQQSALSVQMSQAGCF